MIHLIFTKKNEIGEDDECAEGKNEKTIKEGDGMQQVKAMDKPP